MLFLPNVWLALLQKWASWRLHVPQFAHKFNKKQNHLMYKTNRIHLQKWASWTFHEPQLLMSSIRNRTIKCTKQTGYFRR